MWLVSEQASSVLEKSAGCWGRIVSRLLSPAFDLFSDRRGNRDLGDAQKAWRKLFAFN